MNYHADGDYLESIHSQEQFVYLDIEEEQISIPFIKRNVDGDYFDIATPIGFQALTPPGFWERNIEHVLSELSSKNVVCGYFQTKNDLSAMRSDLTVNTQRYRTNYYFDLSLEIEELSRKQSRDCRQRLNKALSVTTYEVLSGSDISDFYRHYERISAMNEFAENYRFSKQEFINLSRVSDVCFLELRTNQKYMSGGFFALHNNDIDYLFGSNDPEYKESVRLLIWEAVKHFKNLDGNRLYLGGGVRENDSLAQFKRRFCSDEQICTTIRMVVNRKQAERIAGKALSEDWYTDYFPPYMSPQARV